MSSKIVMDSAGDIHVLEGIDFTGVPLKILAGAREFIDNRQADVAEMVSYLKGYNGKTSSSCPGVGEYLDAFGDADNVYCITITSNLSGSCNAARIAAETYQEQHPDRNIHVFDSLSAGPEMTILAEKIRDLVLQTLPFEDIVLSAGEYLSRTRLTFSLESLHNLANNGRVPVAVAKAAGILGIRLIGRASDDGRLQPVGKARGEKKVVPELFKHMTSMGYNGGKVLISHCQNLAGAQTMRQFILERFPNANVNIGTLGCLCSFYAEEHGMLIGYEI